MHTQCVPHTIEQSLMCHLCVHVLRQLCLQLYILLTMIEYIAVSTAARERAHTDDIE